MKVLEVDLPMKKHDFVDVAVFDLKTVEDIDCKAISRMMESKGANLYAILQDQVRPALVRRSATSSVQSLVDKLRELKMTADKLTDGTPSHSVVVQMFDDEMSLESIRGSSSKSKGYEAEDYYVFDVFLDTMDDIKAFKKSLTLESRENAKVRAFGDVMSVFDSRRFSKSAVEDEKTSYQLSVFKVFMTYLETEDFDGIIGLGDATYWLTRVVIKNRISDTSWKMLGCASDISRMKFTDLSVESVKGEK